MKGIGGNTRAILQVKTTVKNAIGEQVPDWQDVQTIKGWLDLASGNSGYQAYSAKIQESTHFFVCDYVKLDKRITAENARMVVNGKRFDIMLIDNPMELNTQLEFYLKYTGGQ
jgi:head-tail adaptor